MPPVDSLGNYSLPNGYLATTGQTILASQHNPPLQDLGAALNLALWRDGRSPLSGNLPANGFKLTGLAAGSSEGDSVNFAQLSEVGAKAAGLVPPGAVQGFMRTSAPTGWVKANGGTIGSSSSGATTRAAADTEALFTVFWESFSNTILPIQNSAGAASTRGASAAADFVANKRLPVFDFRTRYVRGADDGLGFDATITVGATQADIIKNHIHTGTTASSGAHTHSVPTGGTGGGNAAQTGPQSGNGITTNSSGAHTHPFTTAPQAEGSALETRPRSIVVLWCFKL
ncbi:hypothetical protein CN172_04330 [Sinorhizobium meliloti]|uniref:hypothetical protein n=1 Tax=Rhizobium meliloti TaxID=382 RepID=UPI000FD6C311|nr:hypothetical protein [Sinorhizobium meliloti]RVG01623.1 hypothetical protein CN232_08840 [Sinorhizobium meliloti]RVH46568.1 hypothetical protein CN208_07105 [Sinorhizobium meliloti]RVK20066.1 hypothetical protein CN172_04330 [Sinorhizobium meliloti]